MKLASSLQIVPLGSTGLTAEKFAIVRTVVRVTRGTGNALVQSVSMENNANYLVHQVCDSSVQVFVKTAVLVTRGKGSALVQSDFMECNVNFLVR